VLHRYTQDNLDTRYLKMLGWDQNKIEQYKTTVHILRMYSILDIHLFELFALGNIRFRIRVVHNVVVDISHIYCILDIRSRRLFAVNNIRQRIYIVDNLALDMDTRDNLDTRYLKMLGWDQHKIQQYKTTVHILRMYSILDIHLFELFALGNIRFRIRVVHKVVVNISHIYCILDIRSRRLFAVNNIRERIYIVDNLTLDIYL